MKPEPRFTSQQRTAIETEGASVALAAGAGCGKTTVLTSRLAHRLQSSPRPDLRRVAAVTFTEKAARELRSRIREECRRRMVSSSGIGIGIGLGEGAKVWKRVLRELEAASIGTFHSFCGRLLRHLAIRAGIDPGFAVLDEWLAVTVRDEALNLALRKRLSDNDQDLFALAVDYGLAEVRRALSRLIQHRADTDFSAFAQREPAQILGEWERHWSDKSRRTIIEPFAAEVSGLLEVLRGRSFEHPKMRERQAALFALLEDLPHAPDPRRVLEQIREHARVQGAGTAKTWSSADLYEAVRDRLASLRELASTLQAKLEWDEEASRVSAERARRFARLAESAFAEYEAIKRREGYLDFDDLLIKTSEIFDRHPEEAAKAVELLEQVLVDEFQDTDPIQGRIVRQIGGASASQGKLFLVGDSKQSIYRFRRAQPKVFQNFRDEFPENGRLQLTENFRSVPELLDFFNALFLDLYHSDQDALRPSPRTPPRADRVAVEFLWARDLSAGSGLESSKQLSMTVEERRELEARWLARHLARRLAEGWTIRDPATGSERKAGPGDVTLLFRTLNDAAPYEQALLEEGLDYYVVGDAAFFAQQEVQDLVNLLSAIEDPADELALAGLLRSPFFAVSDEGLFWLSSSGRGDILRGFAQTEPIANLSDEDAERIGRAQRWLGEWRRRKDRISIAGLLEQALEQSGYEASLLAEFLGERKRANIRKMVRLARRFDAAGRFALADYAARLRSDLRMPPREEQAATTDEAGDCVRLMTIHQAKGLEFPIVVVVDLNRKPPGFGIAKVAVHPELGLLAAPAPQDDLKGDALGVKSRSMGWMLHQLIERNEEEEEAIRLFYVAVTRARDHLILCAGMAPDEKPESPAVAWLDRHFHLGDGSLKIPLPTDWIAPTVRVIDAEPKPRAAKKSDRIRHRAILKLIRETPVVAESEGEAALGIRRNPPPGSIQLDPCAGLTPRASRIETLARAFLADPDALPPKSRDEAWRRALVAQQPVATVALRDEADAAIPRGWLEALALELQEATEVRRRVAWAMAVEEDGPSHRGSADFLYRSKEGEWTVLNLAFRDSERERLRLRLSAQALAELCDGPIVRTILLGVS